MDKTLLERARNRGFAIGENVNVLPEFEEGEYHILRVVAVDDKGSLGISMSLETDEETARNYPIGSIIYVGKHGRQSMVILKVESMDKKTNGAVIIRAKSGL